MKNIFLVRWGASRVNLNTGTPIQKLLSSTTPVSLSLSVLLFFRSSSESKMKNKNILQQSYDGLVLSGRLKKKLKLHFVARRMDSANTDRLPPFRKKLFPFNNRLGCFMNKINKISLQKQLIFLFNGEVIWQVCDSSLSRELQANAHSLAFAVARFGKQEM